MAGAMSREKARPSIDVTVAAVIEHDARFLMVEERANGKVVYNQPAGHLEPNESLLDAVIRETREETGYRFEPRYLLGIYLWRAETGKSYLRVTFTGGFVPPPAPARLDDGIIAVHWLGRDRLLGLAGQLRSPMVMRCIDDYRAGLRFPLESLTHLDPSITEGARLA